MPTTRAFRMVLTRSVNQRFQIVPCPLVNAVARLGCRRLRAVLVGICRQEKVWLRLFLRNGEFISHAFGRMSIFSTQNNQLIDIVHPPTDLVFPVSRKM